MRLLGRKTADLLNQRHSYEIKRKDEGDGVKRQSRRGAKGCAQRRRCWVTGRSYSVKPIRSEKCEGVFELEREKGGN